MGRKVPEDYIQYNPIFIKLNHSPRKLNKLFVDISIWFFFFFLLLSKDMMNRIQDNNDFGEAEEWDIGRAHSLQVKWSVHWYLFIVLGRTLLALALLHFVLQGQTCLLLQVYLEFLLLHSSPLWWEWKSLSRVQLFVTLWTIQFMEFSRPEYWSGLPFSSPGDIPNPGIQSRSRALQADNFPFEPLELLLIGC